MWGFCKHWMWGVLEEFLKKEGYIKCTDTPETMTTRVRRAIHANGWEDNPDGRLATLYLTGKAKSLLKAQRLWRPITALPQPLLPKRDLKVAPSATTALLRLLAEEIPGNFMVHSINRVADWTSVRTLQSWIARTKSTMSPPPKLPLTWPRAQNGSPNGADGAARRLSGVHTESRKGWIEQDKPTQGNFGF